MSHFTTHDFTAAAYSEAQLTAVVEETGGLLAAFGSGFSCPGAVGGRVGQWALMLVNRQGMGNHGSVIVTACGPQAFEVQLDVTRRMLRRWAEEAEHDDRGNFALTVVPLLASPCLARKGHYLWRDDRWGYFAHHHGNFVRVGDDRHRLWVVDRSILRPHRDCGVYFRPEVESTY